jgi:hypothetical protein
MFPKKGNYFPIGIGVGKGKLSYPAAISAALRAELGDSHQAVKTVMRWTGASERTVKNWMVGRRGPRGEHLLALIRHSGGALEIILRLAGREDLVAAKALLETRDALAEMLARIDTWMSGVGRTLGR